MLGFFTDPYPDELLYSACARYSERTRYPNRKTSLQQIFGSQKMSVVIDFPSRLNTFVAALPEGHGYTAEKLINENTLLPFYEPFLPPSRADLVRKEMKGDADNKVHVRLGIRVKQINQPYTLRFCPACVTADRMKHGETYWHRLHQLAGVFVCPEHNCFLEDSHLIWDKKVGIYFYSAEDFIQTTSVRYIDNRNKDHRYLLKIASDAKWLLSNSAFKAGNCFLRERYFNKLLKRGYAYYNGMIRNSKLTVAFVNYFSEELFRLLGSKLQSDCRNWLLRLFEKSKGDVIYHPIRHLLLMTFLGDTAEEFFYFYEEYKPFGDGPYLCLNRAADHFGQLKIKECRIVDNLSKGKNKSGRPLGIFSCDCEFIYQRTGPDKSEKDRVRYDSVREYGSLWENVLAGFWRNLELSVAEIGRRLSVSSLLVVRHAIRLELPMNSNGTRRIEGYKRRRNPKKTLSQRREQYRKEWLDIVRQNPQATRRQLYAIANSCYLWLIRDDWDWLEKNLPRVVKGGGRKELLDWNNIDRELTEEVKNASRNILMITDHPVRASITEIVRRVGKKSWIEKREEKLPLTTIAVIESVESLEDYMIRKINWAEAEFLKQKRLPTRVQLAVKAAVRNKTGESLKVQKAIDKSLNRLKAALM